MVLGCCIWVNLWCLVCTKRILSSISWNIDVNVLSHDRFTTVTRRILTSRMRERAAPETYDPVIPSFLVYPLIRLTPCKGPPPLFILLELRKDFSYFLLNSKHRNQCFTSLYSSILCCLLTQASLKCFQFIYQSIRTV